MENNELFKSRIDLLPVQNGAEKLKQEIKKVIVGQDKMIDLFLVAVLSDGHVLVEGVPGIAKTLTAKLVAKTMSAGFSRIQFTPDLMPSDVLGTTIFNNHKAEFEFNPGPVFSNIILIDEINRAPAKTQSALFEVMEERQVTIDGKTYPMQRPFLVFATQNPIEHEGTYRLPEAQLDRFLFKIKITYPSPEEETIILSNANQRTDTDEIVLVNAVLSAEEIIHFQKIIPQVHVDENLVKYITEIVYRTRNHPSLYLGASPRASLNIMRSAKAWAAINGRDFIIPEDIHFVAYPVLTHRLYLTPEKELEGTTTEQVIADIVKTVEIPK
ncbi:MAG: MoxR family ATPase [Bacteroidales bacterium]|nr:MoxR family ATPase [Bacteroidales bacterium]